MSDLAYWVGIFVILAFILGLCIGEILRRLKSICKALSCAIVEKVKKMQNSSEFERLSKFNKEVNMAVTSGEIGYKIRHLERIVELLEERSTRFNAEIDALIEYNKQQEYNKTMAAKILKKVKK